MPASGRSATAESERERFDRRRSQFGRDGMWRGSSRTGLSVAAPFVWRCLSTLAVAPFPHPSHRTGPADFPHPALGQDFTPSPTARHAPSARGVRDPRSRRDTREDSPHTRDAVPCACCAYFVSRCSANSSRNAELGGSGHCRITAGDFGKLQPKGRTSIRRRCANDPKRESEATESGPSCASLANSLRTR